MNVSLHPPKWSLGECVVSSCEKKKKIRTEWIVKKQPLATLHNQHLQGGKLKPSPKCWIKTKLTPYRLYIAGTPKKTRKQRKTIRRKKTRERKRIYTWNDYNFFWSVFYVVSHFFNFFCCIFCFFSVLIRVRLAYRAEGGEAGEEGQRQQPDWHRGV